MRVIRANFIRLSANPKPPAQLQNSRDLCNVYCTEKSIVSNFHHVFGYRNENLALRFYNLLADGFNGVYIFLPTFAVKLIGLIEGYPMHLNYFGFRMLDSKLQGEIFATDISDMVQNALEYCPETAPDKVYTTLAGSEMQRSKTDRRCRCALYQELVELYNYFFNLNRAIIVSDKLPIEFESYCKIVKLSVLGFEFRDKLLNRQGCPMLLGHANQPATGMF